MYVCMYVYIYIYIYIYICVNVAKHPKSMPTRSRAIPCSRTNSNQSCTILSFSFLSHTRRTGGLKGAPRSEPRGGNGCSMT